MEKYKNEFKISAPTWNVKLEVSDGSCFIAGIQDYFKYIIKKHGEKTDNPPIRIYNRIKFSIKTGYYLNFLTPETMNLYGRTLVLLDFRTLVYF